jgi:hypothetical protein
MNVFKHGEDKDVIDGLNNKLISMLQEDGLICCRNKAKILVRPKDIKCTQVKTMSRNTIKIVLGTKFDLTIAQSQIKDGKIVDPRKDTILL